MSLPVWRGDQTPGLVAALTSKTNRNGGTTVDMNNPRTPGTIAFNLRQHIAATEPGAQKKTYPNGPGTRPVMAPLTDEERESDRRHAWDAEREWIAVDPRGARAWIDAGRDPNPERYITR